MYKTISFDSPPVLDYAQQSRNIADNVLNRPYNPIQRWAEQEVEQDYKRQILNGFPQQDQYYFQQPRQMIDYSYSVPQPRNVAIPFEMPKISNNIIVTASVVVILSLVLAIMAIIALLNRK